MSQRCDASVWRGSALFSRCQRSGTVERDGKWYCGAHDPVKVKEREEIKTRRIREKIEADEARWKAQSDAAEQQRKRAERVFILESENTRLQAERDALAESHRKIVRITTEEQSGEIAAILAQQEARAALSSIGQGTAVSGENGEKP